MGMENELIDKIKKNINKGLEIQILNEYGREALLEDGKNFTRNEILELLDEVLDDAFCEVKE